VGQTSLQRLTEAAEKAKLNCLRPQAEINLPFITATGMVLSTWIQRRDGFEELCSDLIDLSHPSRNALRDAKVDKSAINEVVLVGGSTRIPAVQI